MKKLIILACCMLFACGVAVASSLEEDGSGNILQGGFAPDGRLSQKLTAASTTIDMTGRVASSIMAPSSGCKVRKMPTSAKGTYPQTTVLDSQYVIRHINKKAAFHNYSSCADAEVEIQ